MRKDDIWIKQTDEGDFEVKVCTRSVLYKTKVFWDANVYCQLYYNFVDKLNETVRFIKRHERQSKKTA